MGRWFPGPPPGRKKQGMWFITPTLKKIVYNLKNIYLNVTLTREPYSILKEHMTNEIKLKQVVTTKADHVPKLLNRGSYHVVQFHHLTSDPI